MAGLSVKLVEAIGQDQSEKIALWVDAIMGERLEHHANRLLNKHENGREWAAAVDGKPAFGRSSFAGARRKIEINFVQASLQVAVRKMEAILRRSIDSNIKTAEGKDWFNKDAVESSVEAFYGGLGKPIRKVNVSEITEFLPGDVVILAPTYPSNVYANASKYGSVGFMRRAAAAIRRAMGVNKRSSPLRVSAERSKAAFYNQAKHPMRRPMTLTDEKRRGTPIEMTIPKVGMDSAWTIAIRYRRGFDTVGRRGK